MQRLGDPNKELKRIFLEGLAKLTEIVKMGPFGLELEDYERETTIASRDLAYGGFFRIFNNPGHNWDLLQAYRHALTLMGHTKTDLKAYSFVDPEWVSLLVDAMDMRIKTLKEEYLSIFEFEELLETLEEEPNTPVINQRGLIRKVADYFRQRTINFDRGADLFYQGVSNLEHVINQEDSPGERLDFPLLHTGAKDVLEGMSLMLENRPKLVTNEMYSRGEKAIVQAQALMLYYYVEPLGIAYTWKNKRDRLIADDVIGYLALRYQLRTAA